MSTTNLWYLIYDCITKLMLHLPHYNLSNTLLSTVIIAHHFNRATLYGLDGPGIESRWEQNFPHPPRPALGPTQLPM